MRVSTVEDATANLVHLDCFIAAMFMYHGLVKTTNNIL